MTNWICSPCIGCGALGDGVARRSSTRSADCLLERGITLRKGRCHLDAALPGILEDAAMKLSGAVRLLLAQLKVERTRWSYASKRRIR